MTENGAADTAAEIGEIVRRLAPQARRSLLDFARFLASTASEPPGVQDPVPIPRPADETVIAAIKRLSASYPMLEKSELLGEVSNLMSAHLLRGRAAAAVIDELERIYRERYERYSTSDA